MTSVLFSVQLERGQLRTYWLELAILARVAFIAFLTLLRYVHCVALRWMLVTWLLVACVIPRGDNNSCALLHG